MHYLDNNATTKPNEDMLHHVVSKIHGNVGNPSSLHLAGQKSRELINEARTNVARLLDCSPIEVYFTSGGTEANNLVLNGIGADAFVSSAVEHSSVSKTLEGKDVVYTVPVRQDGSLDFDKLLEILKPLSKKRVVLSCMYANNETGIILDPDNRLPKLKKEYGFLLHVDACQAVGKVPISFKRLQADVMTFSGHKFHALQGTGGVVISETFRPFFAPTILGGGHERGFRAGTENYPGILSLGYMSKKIYEDPEYQGKLCVLNKVRNSFERLLLNTLDVEIIGSTSTRLPNTSCIHFKGVSASNEFNGLEIFLDLLSENKVMASARSACMSGHPVPSKTLLAMYGKNSEEVKGSVRFSFSVDNQIEDNESIVKTIKNTMLRYKEAIERS